MSQMTDIAENDFIDVYIRGQTSAKPATWTIRLYTAAPGEAGGGTEASYQNYAPATQAASLANFAGTQGAGTTTASTGTGGQTSNNNVLTFGTAAGATGTPQTLTHFQWCNNAAGWFYGTLTSSRTINNGDVAPSFAAAALTLQAA